MVPPADQTAEVGAAGVLSVIARAIIALAIVAAVVGAYKWAEHQGRAQGRAEVTAKWQADKALAAEAWAAQERANRETEQRWRDAQRQSMEIAHAEIDRLQAMVRRADAAAVGLRSQFAAYVADTVSAAEGAATEQQRQAARARAGMQAELFGELDRLAGIYAAEAGRYRSAGLACEREHAAIAPP